MAGIWPFNIEVAKNDTPASVSRAKAIATLGERPRTLGPDAATHRPLAPLSPRPSPFPFEAALRYHLRQEPSAGIPLAGIRGGGGQQWPFLLRPLPAAKS